MASFPQHENRHKSRRTNLSGPTTLKRDLTDTFPSRAMKSTDFSKRKATNRAHRQPSHSQNAFLVRPIQPLQHYKASAHTTIPAWSSMGGEHAPSVISYQRQRQHPEPNTRQPVSTTYPVSLLERETHHYTTFPNSLLFAVDYKSEILHSVLQQKRSRANYPSLVLESKSVLPTATRVLHGPS
jgi:hypothetical protein